MSGVFDATDDAILLELQRNGRVSNREIGRTLGLSEASVRKRLTKLQNQKAFKLALLSDVSLLGLNVSAYIRLAVAPSAAREVALRIAAMPSCGYAALAAGRYNVICFTMDADRAALASTAEQIELMPGVHEVDIREIVNAVKHRFDLLYIT